jgi:hypothetical protein
VHGVGQEMAKPVRGKMSGRRRALLVACDGNREQVRYVEADLQAKSAARRARLRERRKRLGTERPDHLAAVS